MGRKPKDLSGQKFGMLTVKDMTKKEMVEVQSIGIVYVTVGMKLMYQRQDLYKEHVIVVAAYRKKIVMRLQKDDILWMEPVLKCWKREKVEKTTRVA